MSASCHGCLRDSPIHSHLFVFRRAGDLWTRAGRLPRGPCCSLSTDSRCAFSRCVPHACLSLGEARVPAPSSHVHELTYRAAMCAEDFQSGIRSGMQPAAAQKLIRSRQSVNCCAPSQCAGCASIAVRTLGCASIATNTTASKAPPRRETVTVFIA